MRIISDLSVHGLHNVHDLYVVLPEGVEHLVFTGFNGTGKTSILNAVASGELETVTVHSLTGEYDLLFWDRDDVTGSMEYLESHKSGPVVLVIDDAQISLDPLHQRTFLPDLMEKFPNVQILASTNSPFILLDMKHTAVYNLDTRLLYTGLDSMTYDEIGQKAFGV